MVKAMIRSRIAERVGGFQCAEGLGQSVPVLEATDPLSNARPDHRFHHAIVEASHNPILVHILDGLKNMMLLTVQASVSKGHPRSEELTSELQSRPHLVCRLLLEKKNLT